MSRRAAMDWDLPASVVEPGDVDERLRAGVGRTGAMQVLIDHDAPGAVRCPGCGWASTSARRDCPSRVIAKALLERKPLPVWLAHLAPAVPGARARVDARGVEQRQAAEDTLPGLFDPPVRVQPPRAGEAVIGLVDAVVSTPATGRDGANDGGSGAISAPMVAALESAWAAIRARNSELPAVVIVLGAGSGDRGGLRLGHFAAMRWSPTDTDSSDTAAGAGMAEVFVGGEGLARGPVDVLGTLLHEAAHALAHVRGVQDTSRQGRWHNAKFKAIADEVGISVEKDARLGWSPTTVPAATREVYAGVIGELGRALRMRRASETGGAERPKKPGPPACVCGCGRRIRVAVSVREAGPILCGLCETEFAPEEPGDPDEGDGPDGAGERDA